MKKLIKIIPSFIFLIALHFSAFANVNSEQGNMIVRLQQQSPNILSLQVANLQDYRTQVAITDMNGKIWYSEYVWNKSGYSKNLNMDGMPTGDYVLFIQNKADRFTQVFSKIGLGLAFFETENQDTEALAVLTANKAAKGNVICRFSKSADQTIGIQLANLQQKNTTVQLNTLKSEPVLNEKINNENGYSKKFNVQEMDHGVYYFVVRTGQQVYVQFFQITRESVQLAPRQVMDKGAIITDVTVK